MNTNNPQPNPSNTPEESISARQNLLKNPQVEESPFADMEVVSEYSRQQAMEDGVLVDLWKWDLKALCLEHYKVHVAITAAVWALVDMAVKAPGFCNDLEGVIHDILYMSRRGKAIDESTRHFTVYISGTGLKPEHAMKAEAGPGDQAELIITISLIEED